MFQRAQELCNCTRASVSECELVSRREFPRHVIESGRRAARVRACVFAVPGIGVAGGRTPVPPSVYGVRSEYVFFLVVVPRTLTGERQFIGLEIIGWGYDILIIIEHTR